MPSVWALLSLLSAFSVATVDALSKKGLERSPEWLIIWIRFLFALPFLVLGLAFVPLPPLDRTFWLTVLGLLPLEITATVFYIKALKRSPLSLAVPLLALTPVFLLLTGFLFLGEVPTPRGLSGILLVAAGIYVLQVHEKAHGVWAPFLAIAKDRGCQFMMIVAFLYSLTSALGKVAILHSSPFFFGVSYYLLLGLVFTPLTFLYHPRPWREAISPGRFPIFLLIGLFQTLMILSHALAITLTQVAYMIAVKRLSLLFSVGYGYFLFGEKHIRQRLAGGVLMLAGAALILFA